MHHHLECSALSIPLRLHVSVCINNMLATDLSGEYYGDLIERVYIKKANGAMIHYVKDQKFWVLYTAEGAAIARSKSKFFSLAGEMLSLIHI